MISTQTKIEKHKEHIEKRISELENRLREPDKKVQVGKHKPDIQDLPYRRAFAQRQNYIEPQEVTALRERQLNVRDLGQSRRGRINDSRKIYGQYHDQLGEGSNRKDKIGIIENVPKQRRISRQNQKVSNLSNAKTQEIHYPRGIGEAVTNIQDRTQTKQKNDLYDLMTEILANQKNLEKQIVMLRSEWSKEQHMRAQNQRQDGESSQSKKKIKQQRADQIISFQDPEPNENNEQKKIEIVRMAKQKQKQKLKEQQKRSVSSRNRKQGRKREFQQQPTFALDHPNQVLAQSNQQDVTTRVSIGQGRNNRRSGKRVMYEQETQQKIFSLIKNQRCRNQRLVVSQEDKSAFWKQVEGKIGRGEQQVREGGHRNRKCEEEQLINTMELQRKLREDVVSRIYCQVNNCIYK